MKLNSHTIAHQQGSEAWAQHRAASLNASDLAAAMGLSKYQTRSDLIKRLATGIVPEVDAMTQARFDKGHANEAAAEPKAAEVIGEELYPMVLAAEVPGLKRKMSASFDGLTLLQDVSWENKSPNADLVQSVRAGVIPPEYRPQMEQGLMLSGAEKCLFTVSDGEVFVSAWYVSDPELRAKIIPTWQQVEADVAAYVPAEVKEMPKPEVTVALPALFIQAKGEITTSNMKEYGEALAERLAQIRAIQLVTDQDFSNAKESAKMLRENIDAARQAKEAMLAQTVTVGEAARMIDAWCEDMRLTALQLEKDVEREDKAKKASMIDAARRAYEAHIEAAKADTGGPWIVLQAPDWAGAIKGKRNFASMQDALDTALAQGKMAADTSARNIRAALAALDEASKGFEHLFADRLSFIGKSPEDVRMLARARVTQHEAAEKKRADDAAEAARERIRQEEQARADREARDRLAAEQAAAALQESLNTAQQREDARQAEMAGAVLAARQDPSVAARHDAMRDALVHGTGATQTAFVAGNVQVEHVPAANVVPLTRPAAPPVDTGARINLSDIKDRLHPIQITAEGLASLGFSHVATEKASKLYRAADFGLICAALVAHIEAVQAKQAA